MNAQTQIEPKPPYRLTRDLPTTGAVGELRQISHWVAWDYVWKDDSGHWAKMPKNPCNGYNASVSDPATWGTYEAARKCQSDRRFAGVGFVLTADDGFTGGDLDECYQVEGATPAWAQEVLDKAETYFEVSPSGHGVRFLARGKIAASEKADKAGVELYIGGRFLTITGDHVAGTPDAINPAPITLAKLRDRIAAYRATKKNGTANKPSFHIDTGETFWRNVNEAALASLEAWVPKLFPAAMFHPATGAWRITSASLGRDLQEDLSFSPLGIQDWGTERGLTPIDVVIDWGGAPDPREAALWLCEAIGRDPEALGYVGRASTADRGKATSDGKPRPNFEADFDLSQDALASDMGADGWNDDARHIALWGKWLFWTGTHWQRDDKLPPCQQE